MTEFLKFFDELVKRFPLHLIISYNKTCDWSIYIYKKGCAADYPGTQKDKDDNDAVLVDVQDCDMELCFAIAQVQLKEWLSDHRGGY